MRCYICDRVIDKPVFNKDIGSYEPCDVCMEIINDLLKAEQDRPYADEDELYQEDLSSFEFIHLSELGRKGEDSS